MWLAITKHYIEDLAPVLYKCYEDAGQSSDLFRMVEEHERAALEEYERNGRSNSVKLEEFRKCLPTAALRLRQRVDQLTMKGDVGELITICRKSHHFISMIFPGFELNEDWDCKITADALAGCGNKAVKAIRDAVLADGDHRSWLIYALGKCRSPSALEVLDLLALQENDHECDNIAYAISLKGRDGENLLKKIVTRDVKKSHPSDHNRMSEAAERRLKEMKKKQREEPTWPRPAPGSLPKSFQ